MLGSKLALTVKQREKYRNLISLGVIIVGGHR